MQFLKFLKMRLCKGDFPAEITIWKVICKHPKYLQLWNYSKEFTFYYYTLCSLWYNTTYYFLTFISLKHLHFVPLCQYILKIFKYVKVKTRMTMTVKFFLQTNKVLEKTQNNCDYFPYEFHILVDNICRSKILKV